MESFCIYNADREFTGSYGVKGETILGPGEFMLGSNLWLVNPDGHFLIQKRTTNLPTAPGKWAMTGGSVMLGETTRKAAVREMQEELGIRINENELTFVESFVKSYFIIDVWIAMVDYIPIRQLCLQESEVQEARWVTGDEIDRLAEKGEFIDTNWDAIKKFMDAMM